MTPTRFLLTVLAFAPFLTVPIPAADKLYLGDRLGQVVMEIDALNGDRRLIEMEDYPRILTARNPVVDSLETFLFLAFDATQRSSIQRYHVPSDTYEGVSGYTDYPSQDPQGEGPALSIFLTDMVLSPENTLFVLQPVSGPVEVDLETGDRRLLAGDVNSVTGADPPLLEALDLVVESSTTLLIADRFQGIFRMDRQTGDLSVAYPSTDFLSSPYNLERLPNGQLLHCLSQNDQNLYLFDPINREDRILSAGGPFPIGEGEPFVNVWDVSVDNAGRIYVYDLGIPVVFEVSLKTGDRILVSGLGRGQGGDLLGSFNLPILSAGIEARRPRSYWRLR